MAARARGRPYWTGLPPEILLIPLQLDAQVDAELRIADPARPRAVPMSSARDPWEPARYL
ncbi:hypothetical protein [Nonomuraea sp. LPB2021202275-12-8]|uniref:hypothetical protein n=1 Tax=Nonomuraea sp. LPB2021202275-12-8 TaxID=3120159 RepID=UPI00300D0F54